MKIIFFTAGAIATPEEVAAIEAIESMTFQYFIRDASILKASNEKLEHADCVLGTIPEAYEEHPVWEEGLDIGPDYKVLYFQAGSSATPEELEEIQTLIDAWLTVVVRNGSVPNVYGVSRLEAADYVAGTVPVAYEGYPVWDSDTTPDPFEFTDVTGATVDTVYISDTLVLSGTETGVPIPISIVGGEYSINMGSWVSTAGTITEGDEFRVRVTSSSDPGDPVSCTLTIGGVSDTYTVTTEAIVIPTLIARANWTEHGLLPDALPEYPDNWWFQYGGINSVVDNVFVTDYPASNDPETQLNAGLSVYLDEDAYNEVFIEYKVKLASNNPRGAVKFCKVFGSNDGVGYHNETYQLSSDGQFASILFADGSSESGDNAQILFYDGSNPTWIGRNLGIANIQYNELGPGEEPTDFIFPSPDTGFHTIRIHRKFNTGNSAETEVNDGFYRVWVDGNQLIDASDLFNRNYQNAPNIGQIGFNGIVQNSPPLIVHLQEIKISTGGFIEDGYTFDVTDFGVKSSTPVYNDLSTEENGQAVSPVGDLILGYDLDQNIIDTNAKVGKALNCNFADNPFPHNYLELTGPELFYFSCQLYLTGDTTDASVYKLGRIGSNAVYGGKPRSGDSWAGTDALPEGFVGEIVNSEDGIPTSYWEQNTGLDKHNPGLPETVWELNKFLLYEFIFKAGTLDTSDSYTEVRVNGKQVLLWEDRPYLSTETPDLPDWFITPINGIDGGPDLNIAMSQIYYDEGSCAAVIFTDNADYRESTIFNSQLVTGSTNSEVRVDRVTPDFDNGDTVHVHIRKHTGELVYWGTQVL